MKLIEKIYQDHKGDFMGNKYECYDYTIHIVFTFEKYLMLISALSILKTPVENLTNEEISEAVSVIDTFIKDLSTIAE